MNGQTYFRTNFFAVTDQLLFRQWVYSFDGVSVRYRPGYAGRELVAIYRQDMMPTTNRYGKEVDFIYELTSHLPNKEMLIVQEVGTEFPKNFTGTSKLYSAGGKCHDTADMSVTLNVSDETGYFRPPSGFIEDEF